MGHHFSNCNSDCEAPDLLRKHHMCLSWTIEMIAWPEAATAISHGWTNQRSSRVLMSELSGCRSISEA